MPHGESLHDALRRYVDVLRRLLARDAPVTLIVTHEFAVRSIAAAASPDRPLRPGIDIANAVPYLFDQHAVQQAVAGLTAWQDRPGTATA